MWSARAARTHANARSFFGFAICSPRGCRGCTPWGGGPVTSNSKRVVKLAKIFGIINHWNLVLWQKDANANVYQGANSNAGRRGCGFIGGRRSAIM